MTQTNHTIPENSCKKGSHLSVIEMAKIEAWKQDNLSNREIARRLGRSPQTINNAIHKASVTQVKQIRVNGKVYRYSKTKYFADTHMNICESNRKRCRKPGKWRTCEEFLQFAEQAILDRKWSPDACIGYAKTNHLFPLSKIPSLKSLYNWIDQSILKVRSIDLPEKCSRKRPKSKSFPQNKKILGLSIEQRPESVKDRQEFGHWEIDTVEGKKTRADEVVLTMVERKTRFEILFKLKSKSNEMVNELLSQLPTHPQCPEIFKSITSDNGSEFSDLSELKGHVDVYYCHPNSPQERGSSENQHKLIRRFIPKGSSISLFSEAKIKEIQNWMNEYPRRILGYKTAKEQFIEELEKLQQDPSCVPAF